jgi:uncharacterized protein YndB with AHSA1/START domain
MDEFELQVNQEFLIPTALGNVWDFLLDEEKMTNWLDAEEFVINIWDGGGFKFPYAFGGQQCHIIGEVTLLLPQEKYAFTWWEREPSGSEWQICTTVMLNLKAADAGTLISLVHNGFKYLPSEMQEPVHQRYVAYWKESGILERLLAMIMADK